MLLLFPKKKKRYWRSSEGLRGERNLNCEFTELCNSGLTPRKAVATPLKKSVRREKKANLFFSKLTEIRSGYFDTGYVNDMTASTLASAIRGGRSIRASAPFFVSTQQKIRHGT